MQNLKFCALGLPGANPGGDTKYCSKCSLVKNIEDFSFKCKRYNTRQSQCKSCKKEYHNSYYLNNKNVYAKAKEKGKAKGYRSDKQLTDYINSFKINGCILCYEKFYGALDFHHIDPNKKDKSIARANI